MLGWSIAIHRNENRGGKCLLYAVTTYCGLLTDIEKSAEEDLGNGHGGPGQGYPSVYLVRNDRLPRVSFRDFNLPQYTEEREFTGFGNRAFGPLPDVPGDALLWVELWDQS